MTCCIYTYSFKKLWRKWSGPTKSWQYNLRFMARWKNVFCEVWERSVLRPNGLWEQRKLGTGKCYYRLLNEVMYVMETSYTSTHVNTDYLPNIFNLFDILCYLNIIFLIWLLLKPDSAIIKDDAVPKGMSWVFFFRNDYICVFKFLLLHAYQFSLVTCISIWKIYVV